ncbi:MAG: methyltransferase, partial [Leifsonia flava]
MPIPEQHVIPLIGAVVAERVIRFRMPGPPAALHVAGALLLTCAAGLGMRAWREARDVRLADPDRLVTTGPYASSRHPMYRAWAIGHLGWALLTRSGWALAVWLPA